jgi:hypothetical protein
MVPALCPLAALRGPMDLSRDHAAGVGFGKEPRLRLGTVRLIGAIGAIGAAAPRRDGVRGTRP